MRLLGIHEVSTENRWIDRRGSRRRRPRVPSTPARWSPCLFILFSPLFREEEDCQESHRHASCYMVPILGIHPEPSAVNRLNVSVLERAASISTDL